LTSWLSYITSMSALVTCEPLDSVTRGNAYGGPDGQDLDRNFRPQCPPWHRTPRDTGWRLSRLVPRHPAFRRQNLGVSLPLSGRTTKVDARAVLGQRRARTWNHTPDRHAALPGVGARTGH